MKPYIHSINRVIYSGDRMVTRLRGFPCPSCHGDQHSMATGTAIHPVPLPLETIHLLMPRPIQSQSKG